MLTRWITTLGPLAPRTTSSNPRTSLCSRLFVSTAEIGISGVFPMSSFPCAPSSQLTLRVHADRLSFILPFAARRACACPQRMRLFCASAVDVYPAAILEYLPAFISWSTSCATMRSTAPCRMFCSSPSSTTRSHCASCSSRSSSSGVVASLLLIARYQVASIRYVQVHPRCS
ncbi:hypothetical protein DFH06DRAFT_1259612 [Mycena polygramma]|nr:hypothetical protein DFH06DRAFT_1259612 [Mycena polygramma]